MEELEGLAETQSVVDRRDRFALFTQTDGFKEFIDEAYFEEEAMRLPHAMTNHAMQDEVDQRSILEMVTAIGHFKNFLDQIIIDGNSAQKRIEEAKQEEINRELAENQRIEIDPITGDECIIEED